MDLQTAVIARPSDMTLEWLGSVLGHPVIPNGAPERIGTGQMSESYRVRFTAPGDATERSVIVKVPATDPTSRATGVGLGAYAREVALYENLGSRVGDAIPPCHLAALDPATGGFTLVLGDASPAEPGDQVAGCAPQQARAALRQLARIQAPFINDAVLGNAPWLNLPNPLTSGVYLQLLPGALAMVGEGLDDAQRQVLETFGERVDAWHADRRAPLGLVHGDFRLDNLLFHDDSCTVVDWQTVTWGSPLYDVAYFLGGSLTVADRRAHEDELVRGYHTELLELGVRGLSWEHCWDEYRRQAFSGVLMAVVAVMVVQRTERGDAMFSALLERHTRQLLDLHSEALLPELGAPPAAPQPEPEDEGLHDPGPEPSWNESTYLDAVSDAGDLGVYVRLGRLPNQAAGVYGVCVCGPGRPSVMLALDPVPLPEAADSRQVVEADGLRAEHAVEEPLRRATVRLTGTAGAHADASAPLRGEVGDPIEIELDLEWETAGVPYAWRTATRYEIPCRVTGTVRIGTESLDFTGSGQRDHSWGTRDWWTLDWMWSALHLDDGTRVHAVGVPGMPGGVGYLQRDGAVKELTNVEATDEPTADGLTASARIAVQPGDLAFDIEPVAFGALRFEAPDGRVSHLPRALCRVRATDGREGMGWVEWNRVQRQS